jgi:hypothetical protein
MNQEWIEPHWRKQEGLCYFEAGQNKDWRVTVWEDGSGGYDITVHYKRANKVKGRKVAWFSEIFLPGVKVMAEELFEEIKSSIND